MNPKIKGIPRVSSYAALANFARNVVTAMTTNVAFYAAPAPGLATISAAIVVVDADIAAWGPPHARGPHSALMNLRASCLTLRALLIQEAGYVITTVIAAGGSEAVQAANIILSGFSVKNLATAQGLLNAPENLHQWFKNGISIYHVGVKWSKPVGLNSPGNVKLYVILRGSTNDPAAASTIAAGTSTRTSFIDTSVAHGTSYFYWVQGFNDAGAGALSASLSVTVAA